MPLKIKFTKPMFFSALVATSWGGASVQLDINFICQSRPYNCIFENASAKAVLIGSFASFACFRK